MLHRLVYAIYLAGAFFARTLSLQVGFQLGRWFGLVSWMLAHDLRRIALGNLTASLGDKHSEREILRIGRESFCRIGANLVSSIKLAAMPADAVMRRVEFHIPPEVEQRRRTEKTGWVAMISHLGNWELYAQIRNFLSEYQIGAVYQPLSNSYIDAAIRKDRARFGVRLFDRRSSLVQASRFLREGGVVGVLVDQYAGEPGVWTPFFGRLASTSPLAAALAGHAEVPVVPIAVYTIGLARWRVVVSPIVESSHIEADQLTAEMTQILEKQIAVSPEDWLWAHDRWKTPSPGFLLASTPRGVMFPENWQGALRPFRILVIAPDDLIGNVACARAVRAIRAGRPDTVLTVFAPADCVPVWERCDAVAEVSTNTKIGSDYDAAFVFGERPMDGLDRIPRKIFGRDFALPNQGWDEALYTKIVTYAGAIPD